MQVFGFEIKRSKEEEISSVVNPTTKDGSYVIETNGLGGGYGQGYGYDPDGTVATEQDLIRRYRELASYPEVAEAIEDIVNETISITSEEDPVEISLDDLKVSDPLKKKIQESFSEIIKILNFNETGYEIFEKWYVDGKIYFQILLNPESPRDGIVELREIDPRKIKKIKKINKKRLASGVEVIENVEEFFIFNEKGISDSTSNGVKLSNDSVIYVTSGLFDQSTGLIHSHLKKAIRPANQLKMLEDAVVIYRLTRAPERRIFYIDVGNLPKGKAEQYVNDTMNKFKNKLVYNAQTGEVMDSKKHLSMMEDFWLARRDGGKGTEVTTLPGGQGLGQLDDLDYFKDKLYHSLNVPVSRMKPDTGFTLGRSTEISRDEIKFAKFIEKLRSRFNGLFFSALKIQLISKGIVSELDWDEIKQDIKFKYAKDNFFSELKEQEILQSRINAAAAIDPDLARQSFSKAWIQKNIFKLSEEEIEDIKKEQEQELADNPPLGEPPESQ
jgi:hypothetical protein